MLWASSSFMNSQTIPSLGSPASPDDSDAPTSGCTIDPKRSEGGWASRLGARQCSTYRNSFLEPDNFTLYFPNKPGRLWCVWVVVVGLRKERKWGGIQRPQESDCRWKVPMTVLRKARACLSWCLGPEKKSHVSPGQGSIIESWEN